MNRKTPLPTLLAALALSSPASAAFLTARPAIVAPMSAHIQATMPYMGQPRLMADALTRSISAPGASLESQLAGRLLIDALSTGDSARIAALVVPAAPPVDPRAAGAVAAPAAADPAAVIGGLNALSQSIALGQDRDRFTATASAVAVRLDRTLRVGTPDELASLIDRTFSGGANRGTLDEGAPAVAQASSERRHPLAALARFIPRPAPRTAKAVEGPVASPKPTQMPAPAQNAGESLVALGQSLRAQGINPRATHVPEFAQLIPRHLAYARGAIVAQNEDRDRLALLEDFEREAMDRSQRGHVTYEWWNDFNFRLTMLMTPASKRTAVAGGANDKFTAELLRTGAWQTNAGFREVAARQPKEFFGDYASHSVAKSFPGRVVIPLLEGEIPSEDMNAMFGTNIDVLGIIDRMMRVDGREMWPDHFYRHDHVHASNEEFAEMRYELDPGELALLRRNYLAYRGTLSGDRSKAFEFGYHMATHELPLADEIIRSGGSRLSGRAELAGHLRNPDWYAGHAPEWALASDASARRFVSMTDAEMAAFARRFYPR